MRHISAPLSPNRLLAAVLAAALLAPAAALAKQSDFKEPISVDSGRQTAELESNRITFTEDVIIRQGTIKITADRVEILRTPEGQIKSATATGAPATFFQILDNGKPVRAEGRAIAYYPGAQTVELRDGASIEQGHSKIAGDTITYNIAKERMEATGSETKEGKSGRVTTVFIPEELKRQIDESKGSRNKR